MSITHAQKKRGRNDTPEARSNPPPKISNVIIFEQLCETMCLGEGQGY